jgi:hypothetical protein
MQRDFYYGLLVPTSADQPAQASRTMSLPKTVVSESRSN